MTYKVGFIGLGNMGTAILCGAVTKAGFNENDIYAHSLAFSDRAKEFNINVTNLKDLVINSDYIILCVKPSGFEDLLNEIKAVNGYIDKTYISIAAGITLDYMESILGNVRIIRAMPNIALTTGFGMTTLCPNGNANENDLLFAEKLFSGSGKSMRIDEKLMDICTAINGSGPAYVFMFIEALADAAVQGGVPRADAYVLASQTVMGSAFMQLETGIHPAILKDMVCSPGGTTIEAVASLENYGLRSCVINAVKACAEKSKAMSKDKK